MYVALYIRTYIMSYVTFLPSSVQLRGACSEGEPASAGGAAVLPLLSQLAQCGDSSAPGEDVLLPLQ